MTRRVLRGDERVRVPSRAAAMRAWLERLDRGEILTGLGHHASGRSASGAAPEASKILLTGRNEVGRGET